MSFIIIMHPTRGYYIVQSTAQSGETLWLCLPIYPDIPKGPSSEPEIAAKLIEGNFSTSRQATASGFKTILKIMLNDDLSWPLRVDEQIFHSWISQLSNGIQRCWWLLFKSPGPVVNLSSCTSWLAKIYLYPSSPGQDGKTSELSDHLAYLHRTIHCQPITI